MNEVDWVGPNQGEGRLNGVHWRVANDMQGVWVPNSPQSGSKARYKEAVERLCLELVCWSSRCKVVLCVDMSGFVVEGECVPTEVGVVELSAQMCEFTFEKCLRSLWLHCWQGGVFVGAKFNFGRVVLKHVWSIPGGMLLEVRC